MNIRPIRYSIVVPVYNEQENVKRLLRNIHDAMDRQNDVYEIICVDDGSTDDSLRILKDACRHDRCLSYITFDRNYGQTAALDAGIHQAQGELVIIMDADLQVDANDIPTLLDELGNFDAVVGYRQKRNDSLNKRISSYIANKVRNYLSDEKIRDVGCPLKVFKAHAIKSIKLYEGMHRFFPTLLKIEGYTVKEVPINHYPRQFGKSKYNVRNRVFRAFKDLLAVRWMKQRAMQYTINGRSSCEKETTTNFHCYRDHSLRFPDHEFGAIYKDAAV
ncbi:glycosyltransferase family 2 protein [candidate division KSB1 bacterium]|nr:glycosyltransferase family 2 protein [candidate division KSB1 bacterium]